jgi:hypothetical protein
MAQNVTSKWTRRHKVGLGLALAALTGACAGIGSVIWSSTDLLLIPEGTSCHPLGLYWWPIVVGFWCLVVAVPLAVAGVILLWRSRLKFVAILAGLLGLFPAPLGLLVLDAIFDARHLIKD